MHNSLRLNTKDVVVRVNSSSGPQSWRPSERLATVILLLCLNAGRIDETQVGRLVINLKPAKAQLEVVELLDVAKVTDDGATVG